MKCLKKYDKIIPFCNDCKENLLLNSSDEGFIKKVEEASLKNYVLTLDNYIKMLLIYMRVKAKIPVIIKGETGCGKTSLIKFLCTKILEDDFHLISIHAGITEEFIVEEMKKIIEKAEVLKFIDDKIKVWVFFDEFNTTESIGIIKEVICERTILGEIIPENVVFLGACNPFRLKSKDTFIKDNIGIKKPYLNHKYNLLYTVQPLPESLIEYVWDYGHLTPTTEKEYIETMLRSCDFGTNSNKMLCYVVELVSECHRKFREWEDVSSVSLRDVVRYKILFTWFAQSIKKRLELKKEKNKRPGNLYQQAAVLSLLHCYFLRISSQNRRNEFLNEVFDKFSMNRKDVELLLYEEENDFLERMSPLPEGIAKNQALRENVFALIVCIVNKIPLFICGKPGCSKSLAIQLVFTHLRGRKSKDPYFRTLPELIPTSYQGSEYCTSESILSVFARAEKYLNATTEKDILPVIWFDEIGLAELSPNNPLKVLHNKLEIENIKVAFVGISNWRLDASKMNRALYLARPDPNKEDLKFTAKEIFKSIQKNYLPKNNMIDVLAQIYVDLRERLKEKRKDDIYGLRDFYHLNKGISTDFSKLENRTEIQEFTIVRKNLKKNFSGLGKEHEILWTKYCEFMGKPEKIKEIGEPSVVGLISSNLKDRNSRYLMIITDNDCISEYIEDILKKNHGLLDLKGQNLKVIVGSHMTEDNKESYGYRILSDVILYIEKGYTLIFKKVDHIYSSLYDLFNQNFSWSGDKKYCRIALGALYNPKCLVDPDFHCLIFLNEKELEKADPPFLNRFEKYHLKLDDILNNYQFKLLDDLHQWVVSITGFKENHILDAKLLFPNISREYLIFLIMSLTTKDENNDREKLLKLCQFELIKIASFDFPVLVTLNIRDTQVKNELLKEYYQIKSEGFHAFIQRSLKNQVITQKVLLYTYTQITENISYKGINMEIKEIKLGNFKSEQELKEEIKRYFMSTQTLLVIRVNHIFEGQHLLSLKHVISHQLDDDINPRGKHILIIIHLQRFYLSEIEFETLFQDWNLMMFDYLNEEYLLPMECLEDETFSKLADSKLMVQFPEIFYYVFDDCMSKFKYLTKSNSSEKINERRNFILENLKKNTGNICSLIYDHINNIKNSPKDTNRKIITPFSYLKDGFIKATSISPFEAIKMCLINHYKEDLFKIVYKIETLALLDSYFNAILEGNQDFKELWIENFKVMKFDMNQIFQNQLVIINLCFDLKFPFSKFEHKKIEIIQQQEKEYADINENLIDTVIFENFLEISVYEKYKKNFYEILFENTEKFKNFMIDQIKLFLFSKNLDFNVEKTFDILQKNFFRSHKKLFIFFLKDSKRMDNILRAIEEIIELNIGYDIFEKAQNCLIYYENKKLVKNKNLPNTLLLYSQTQYYMISQSDLEELEDENIEILVNLQKNNNENPFFNIFFENIIEMITSIEYLMINQNISNLKNILISFQENIVKAGFIPSNLENLVPWNEIIEFLYMYDSDPNKIFQNLIKLLKNIHVEGFFSNVETINIIIEFLRNEMKFNKKFENEKDNKFIKLKCQLFKNIASISQTEFNFFEGILKEIDEKPNLWKNSSKIFHFLDISLDFSTDLKRFQGNITKFKEEIFEDTEKLQRIKEFEKIINNCSIKIISLFLNKIFSLLIDEWYNQYIEHLSNKFEIFEEIIDYLKKNSKVKNFFNYFCLIWIKVYLFFYGFAILNLKKFEKMDDIEKILCNESNLISSFKIYLMKFLLQQTKKTQISELKDLYFNLHWLKPYLIEQPNDINIDLIIPWPFEKIDIYSKMEHKINKIYSSPEKEISEFIEICENLKNDYHKSIWFYSWFLRIQTKYFSEKFTPNKVFINFIEDNKGEISKEIGDLGFKVIMMMLKNFKKNSFFCFESNQTSEEIYKKLCALDLLIKFISQKYLNTKLSCLLFDNKELPKTIANYFKKILIFGLSEIDFVIENMKQVKLDVDDRLKKIKFMKKPELFTNVIKTVIISIFSLDVEDLQFQMRRQRIMKNVLFVEIE